MVTLRPAPFSLGFEGEYWNHELKCLVIPYHDRNIIVTPRGKQFEFEAKEEQWFAVTTNDWIGFESLFMAVAYIRNYMDELDGQLCRTETPSREG